MALGGEVLTTTVEGTRARFGVIVALPRDARSDRKRIEREVLVP